MHLPADVDLLGQMFAVENNGISFRLTTGKLQSVPSNSSWKKLEVITAQIMGLRKDHELLRRLVFPPNVFGIVHEYKQFQTSKSYSNFSDRPKIHGHVKRTVVTLRPQQGKHFPSLGRFSTILDGEPARPCAPLTNCIDIFFGHFLYEGVLHCLHPLIH